jgi:RNA 2',3'-cyclic 3'-phosphodiesterase
MEKDIVRLFIAAQIGEENASMARKVAELNSNVDGINWTKLPNLHITLFFIGETSSRNQRSIIKIMDETADQLSPFTLNFDRYELKGKKDRPSMVWATFQSSELFSIAAKSMESALKHLSSNPNHHSDPIPHCTLGRIKKVHTTGSIDLNANPMIPITVNKCELWQTTGGIYNRIAVAELGKK